MFLDALCSKVNKTHFGICAFKVKKTELLALHPSVHPSALFCSYMYLLDPLVFSTLLLFVPWILVLTNHPTLMICTFDKGKHCVVIISSVNGECVIFHLQ